MIYDLAGKYRGIAFNGGQLGFALITKLARFGVVGITATAVHAVIVVVLVEFIAVDSKVATAIAFLMAFFVSYLGGKKWVFVNSGTERYLLFRFLSVSCISFLLSLLGMYWVVDILYVSYLWGVFISCVLVPLVTFYMHNNWTFSYGVRNKG